MPEPDPLANLTEAAERLREAKRLMEEAFALCVEHGYAYSVIGEAMGLSKQEVHARALRRGLERKPDG